MKISACYIVKDEADELRRSLRSLQDAVDEIIIVSTAACSAVAEAAANVGAEVYDFPWQNDFSLARNYALTRVTGDFVIFLDADEYFLEPAAVRTALVEIVRKQGMLDIVMLRRSNFMTKESTADVIYDYSPRILRGAGLHYAGMMGMTALPSVTQATLQSAVQRRYAVILPCSSRMLPSMGAVRCTPTIWRTVISG